MSRQLSKFRKKTNRGAEKIVDTEHRLPVWKKKMILDMIESGNTNNVIFQTFMNTQMKLKNNK